MERIAESNEVIGMSLLFPSEIEQEFRSLLVCGDDDFEWRFRKLIQDVEDIFRISEGSLRTNKTIYAHDLDGTHAGILGILHHAYARVIASDHYFGRKIIQILVSRFPRRMIN